jgi:hypothetical protein
MGCYYVKEYKFASSLLVVTLGKLYRVALFLYSVTICHCLLILWIFASNNYLR